MKKLIFLIVVVTLAGCAQSGYQKFYYPYEDAQTLDNVERISEGEEPKVFGSDDMEEDSLILLSKGYIAIGYSSFNGEYEDTKNAASQATRIGASVVLVNSEYTNTQTTTSSLLIPKYDTTYHTGSISANTTYNSGASSSTSGIYSGTSTTSSTQSVPITTHQRRFDQNAIYFVKSTQEYKFGVYVDDLTPEQRSEVERNNGALITVVIEDSPAFSSNIFAGDVLTAIDGTNVRNARHAGKLMEDTPDTKQTSIFTVIRSGEELDVQVNL